MQRKTIMERMKNEKQKEIYSYRTPRSDCYYYYPAGAEFLTFVSFFFLIIKYL